MVNDRGIPFVPITLGLLGIMLPIISINFDASSYQAEMYGGSFTAFSVIIWALFRKLFRRSGEIRKWVKTKWGDIISLFLGCFLTSTFSVLFAILPLPFWLHISLGVVLAITAFFLMLSLSVSSEFDSNS
jgi:hypothetical protein